jgi:hypothetical protein
MPGSFTGLDGLIQESKCVAIIRIYEQKEMDMQISGRPVRYHVVVEKIFLGEGPPSEADMLLFSNTLNTKIKAQTKQEYGISSFAPFSRHLVFLTNEGNFKPQWSNLNIPGSFVPIAPVGSLSCLDGLSIRQAIALLAKQYIDYKKNELANTEQTFEMLLKPKK